MRKRPSAARSSTALAAEALRNNTLIHGGGGGGGGTKPKAQQDDDAADIEAQLSLLEQMLQKEREGKNHSYRTAAAAAASNVPTVTDEAAVLQIEKRALRYEIAAESLRQLNPQSSRSLDAVRRHKQELFRKTKRQHMCDPRVCKWSSKNAKDKTFDPRVVDRSAWCYATGNVYVCQTSGKVHYCGDRCRKNTRHAQGIYVCEISGRDFGAHISHVEGRRPRPELEEKYDHHQQHSVAAEGNDDHDDFLVQALDDDDDDADADGVVVSDTEEQQQPQLQLLKNTPPTRKRQKPSTTHPAHPQRQRRRKRSKGDDSDADDTTGGLLLAAAATREQNETYYETMQQLQESFFGRQAETTAARQQLPYADDSAAAAAVTNNKFFGGTRRPPPPVEKFAHGSIAQRMQERSAGGRASVEADYGANLIRFAFEFLTNDNRRCAYVICDVMMHNSTVQQMREMRLHTVHKQAELLVERYVQQCVQNKVVPDFWFVRRLFWTHHKPWISFILSSCSPSNDEHREAACNYFGEAVLRIWKILECTPFYCAAVLERERGGAASKKRRTRTHLKQIAPAIVYLLRSGLSFIVAYDKPTRKVVAQFCLLHQASKTASDAAAAPASEPQLPADIVRETVVFVPEHRYLATRIPSMDDFNILDFRRVPGEGQIGTDVMSKSSWIQRCIRSLLTCQPPLTIDTVREYCMSAHMRIFDESPQTGDFEPVPQTQQAGGGGGGGGASAVGPRMR